MGQQTNPGTRSGENTRKLALSGILSAFIVICLVLESIVPTGRLGFYVLAAFILSVILMEAGVGMAWVSYVVTCGAGFLAVPEKLNILPYVMFFGIFTLVKFHIEVLRRPWLEIVLKIAFFNLFLWPAWSIAKTFLPPYLTSGKWVVLTGIGLQAVFILYDFLFTALIRYYLDKIAPRIRKS